ncbi:MAG: hypothetical protein QM533_02995 [Cytophagales bacterium]|nr:hypothetical protein [Cytophagales bacterium]
MPSTWFDSQHGVQTSGYSFMRGLELHKVGYASIIKKHGTAF